MKTDKRHNRGKALLFEKRQGTINVQERMERVDRTQKHAVLATVFGRSPYTSLIAYALTPDLRSVVFATPKATGKYRNMLRNSRVSLLIDTRTNTNKDYLGAEALTILGAAKTVRRGRGWGEMAGVLIQKHPDLAEFVNAPGTALMRVKIERCIHAGRFQTVSEWRPGT